MSLSIDSRSCGRVYVIKCFGRIVHGEESQVLESAFIRGLQDSNRIVVEVSEVSRVDSTGMGVLVRFLSRVRNNGGDLRLASPQPFFRKLLDLTKLATVFRIYDSEDEAIVSFLKEPAVPRKETAPAGPLVLFVDQSPDLCAFVRKVLNGHGYEAATTCRLHDAKLLLSASDVSYLVLGPDCSELPCDQVVATLRPLARNAALVQLEPDFRSLDAEHAASTLLQHLGTAS
jgi:anti-sigma B factor antagonist